LNIFADYMCECECGEGEERRRRRSEMDKCEEFLKTKHQKRAR